MSSRNSNFTNHLPDIPWWVIILSFFLAAPLGIVLLIMKIARDSTPKRSSRPVQTHSYPGPTVTQDTHYDVPHASAARSKAGAPRQAKPASPANARYAKLPNGKGFTILGAIFAVSFGIAVGNICIEYGFSYPQYILQDAFVPMIFACGGVGMFLWGRHLSSQNKKFRRYLARIGNEPLISLRPLAESLPADLDEVYDTLQRMIDLGLFGDRAYLDMASETLVMDSAVAKPAPKEKPEPAPTDAALSPEDEILRQIRDANDRIPGEEISRKIDRIEEITRHILTYQKKHPERSSELHTFLDYYLPTTLKMLNTYAELDAQQLEGDNISVTKERIEQILDKVVEGFEAQLDKLFEGAMLDISSDIDVMEKMLQRDGLAGDLKMPKAPAAPKAAQGYTPKLTLTPDQTSGTAAAAAPAEAQHRTYDDLGMW